MSTPPLILSVPTTNPAMPLTKLAKTSQSERIGTLGGRLVTPFSYYVLLGGAMLGIIVGIAGWILNLKEVSAVSIFLVATNLLGAFQIKELELDRPIEDALQEMKNEDNSLDGANHTISEEVKQLRNVNSEYKKIFQDQKNKIATQTKMMEDANTKLLQTESNFAKLAKQSALMQSAMENFVASSASISTIDKAETESLNTLTAQLKESDITKRLLANEQVEFEKTIGLMKAYIEKVAGIPQTIQTAVGQLKGEYESIQKQNEDLKKTGEGLNSDSKEIQKKIDELKEERTLLSQLYTKMELLTVKTPEI